jgi:hypothetical protein
MSKDNGGPAFPQGGEWQEDMDLHTRKPEMYDSPSAYGNGMTLRDYFAAKAMNALIASDKNFTSDPECSIQMKHWGDYAMGAYQVADAMLLERAK